MKNILSKLFFLALVLGLTNCANSGTNTQEQSEEPTETTTEAPTDESTPTDEASAGSVYEVIVVKDGIASPRKEMKGQIGGAEVTVNYGSPSVKGRTIWGDLVPFGEVWRTGANEATSIELSQAVSIEGQNLAAGKYGLFTIPKEDGWVIIFNEVAEQWGAYDYDETKDVLRVEVSSAANTENSETMDFAIEGEAIVLMWDNIKVPFKISAS